MTDVTDKDRQIAMAMRAARIARGLTLTQVSEHSGVSVAHLSRIENAERMPTVRVLLQLARSYDTSLSDLVGEGGSDSDVYVSRASARRGVGFPEASVTPLSNPRSSLLQAFELSLEPGRQGESTVHPGEEWIRVQRGRIELVVAGTATDLGIGDVAQFAANLPHHLSNHTSEHAEALIFSSIGRLTAATEH
ncbi:helix-turn-helix transcriptional regulator [Microbacteriaceae bacterium VKM Ac-2855]|nr:helix-turn-helix transcriptional regulator [Microbacteriaceae bacterium VKM Ac-2855]